jgi:succinyl-diaminopimelate desuccinylase
MSLPINSIINLTKKLVRIPSVAGDARACKKVLETALLPLSRCEVTAFEHKGSRSVLVSAKSPAKKFRLLLNAHLDIIPAKPHQFRPYLRGNRLYGAGVMDMKAAAACLIFAFKQAAEKLAYPLALQLVTDEEVGGFCGTLHQLQQGIRAEFALIGESTALAVERRAKGILWAKVKMRGRSAHGAYPWRGKNAAWMMQDFLARLRRRFPLPPRAVWRTTVNLACLATPNHTFNKIPDYCEAWLDVRFISADDKKIGQTLRKLLPPGAKLEIVLKEPPFSIPATNAYLKLLRAAAKPTLRKLPPLVSSHGSSDARHFARYRIPAVEFGPRGGGMGGEREWVDLRSLEQYYQILVRFLVAAEKLNL